MITALIVAKDINAMDGSDDDPSSTNNKHGCGLPDVSVCAREQELSR